MGTCYMLQAWYIGNGLMNVQVLVSIQSMILVDDPYFNEPGYESSRDSAHGRQASDRYNANIRNYTLQHAVLPALTKPNAAFADIIRWRLPLFFQEYLHPSAPLCRLWGPMLRLEQVLKISNYWKKKLPTSADRRPLHLPVQ